MRNTKINNNQQSTESPDLIVIEFKKFIIW